MTSPVGTQETTRDTGADPCQATDMTNPTHATTQPDSRTHATWRVGIEVDGMAEVDMFTADSARAAVLAWSVSRDVYPPALFFDDFADVNRDGSRFENVDWATGHKLVVERVTDV